MAVLRGVQFAEHRVYFPPVMSGVHPLHEPGQGKASSLFYSHRLLFCPEVAWWLHFSFSTPGVPSRGGSRHWAVSRDIFGCHN